jgi:uncharacterized membrane protein
MENSQKRTETLFDAVIAIAMTMIALEINLPEVENFDSNALHLLFGEITIYFISFIVLASIWGVHALIYSSYASLGTPMAVVLNIVLMFIVTLFPVLTKLMDTMEGSLLLNVLYLGCYALMDILVVFLLILANRKNARQEMENLRNASVIIELCKDKMKPDNYKAVHEKMNLVEKYMDEPATFSLLYQELMSTLPEHIISQLSDERSRQRVQYFRVIMFYLISFAAVLFSVLCMMVNPYWCYLIILFAIIIFFI